MNDAITTNAGEAFAELSRRLEAAVEALALARARSVQLALAGDPTRWRRADLLWPGFASAASNKE
jgi:hypothetical protein